MSTEEDAAEVVQQKAPNPELASTIRLIVEHIERGYEEKLRAECERLTTLHDTEVRKLKTSIGRLQAELTHFGELSQRQRDAAAGGNSPSSSSAEFRSPIFMSIKITQLPRGISPRALHEFVEHKLQKGDVSLEIEFDDEDRSKACVTFDEAAIAAHAVRVLDGLPFEKQPKREGDQAPETEVEEEEEEGEVDETVSDQPLVVYPDWRIVDRAMSVVLDGLRPDWTELQIKKAFGPNLQLSLYRIDRVDYEVPTSARVYFSCKDAVKSALHRQTLLVGERGTQEVALATISSGVGSISELLNTVAAPDHSGEKVQYAEQLQALSEMGFRDEERNLQLLSSAGGRIEDVLAMLCV